MSSAAASSTPGNDSSPDIAVVIPAWNAEAYLEATVATVLRQSYQAFELIIVRQRFYRQDWPDRRRYGQRRPRAGDPSAAERRPFRRA